MSIIDFVVKLLSRLSKAEPHSNEQRPAQPLPPERVQLLTRLEPSPFGLNSHLAPPHYLHRFADIGIQWHRIDLDWNFVERRHDDFDWARLDEITAVARERNLALLGAIAYTPAWAGGAADVVESEDDKKARMPTAPSDYLRFVEKVVERYGNYFRAFSIWNEPNLRQFFRGSRRDYIDKLLVPALRLIRDHAPQIMLVGPDLSSSPSGKPYEWLGEVLDAAGDLLDVISHHQYDGDDTPHGRSREIESLRKFVAARGYADRPIWITETGWKLTGARRPEQARLLKEMMAEMQPRREWWTKTFWYDSHGEGWGLLLEDGNAAEGEVVPAFAAYAEVITQNTGHLA